MTLFLKMMDRRAARIYKGLWLCFIPFGFHPYHINASNQFPFSDSQTSDRSRRFKLVASCFNNCSQNITALSYTKPNFSLRKCSFRPSRRFFTPSCSSPLSSPEPPQNPADPPSRTTYQHLQSRSSDDLTPAAIVSASRFAWIIYTTRWPCKIALA